MQTFKVREGQWAIWQEYIDKNTDPYGFACIEGAAKWAAEIEARIVQGKTLDDVAWDAWIGVGNGELTGFMYGVCVGILFNVWEHGEALRQWSNRDILGERAKEANDTPGAIANPALWTIRDDS